MDKERFARLLAHPEDLRPEEWEELRRERDRFPFSAPLQFLSLVADKVSGMPLWEQQSLPRVELYFDDVSLLRAGLAAASRPQAAPLPPPPQPQHAAAAPQRDSSESAAEAKPAPQPPRQEKVENASFDVLKEINAYQEVSFKTAPKSVILSNFLEKDGGITLSKTDFEEVPVQELAKNSIRVDQSLGSETLAVVLERQGKLAQALAMYEKLMANNPEKSSTFAVRIADLRKRMSVENI